MRDTPHIQLRNGEDKTQIAQIAHTCGDVAHTQYDERRAFHLKE